MFSNIYLTDMETCYKAFNRKSLDMIKDKKLTDRYKITKQNVIEAFPELGLQYEQ